MTLQLGSTGPDVEALQQRLIELGFSLDASETDVHAFGPTTAAAVMTAQRNAGITIDGVVGPQTEKALARAVSAMPADWRIDIDNARPEVKPALLAAWADLRRPTFEVPKGSNRSPVIDGYWCGDNSMYGEPWCAAAASSWVRKCSPDPIGKVLASALKWRDWGVENHALIINGDAIIPGDVGIFLRPNGTGHAELVVANLGDGRLADIGGNVGDAVSATVRPRTFFNYVVRPVRLVTPAP